MTRDFFDPPWEETNVVLVDRAVVERAQEQITGCERCRPVEAELPFDWILDEVTGSDPSNTDYVLEVPAKSPLCRTEIREKTLVERS
jgi:hypothetical protein